ncbi:MAG TPA: metal ABC transporter substrate-binding protein [Tepidisphaeraceae bacterium]|nr:metal ABC transporter substrate-binding protein [Tepidisphaeraceae bacterium]
MPTATFGVCLLLLTLSLTVGGCDQRASRTWTESEPVSVIATVLPLADIARQIGGTHVSVWWVIETGQSIAGMQSTPQLRNRLRTCNLVLSGGSTEPWAVEGFDDPFQAPRVLRLDLLQAARDAPAGALLWLDPLIIEDFARELKVKLAVARPALEPYFAQQRDQFISSLHSLIQPYKTQLAAAPAQAKKILTLGCEYDALLRRFGLEPVLAIEAMPTQLSDRQIAMLRMEARNNAVSVLLVSADLPAAVVRDLENRTGLRIVQIDALGSSAAGGRNTYLQILQYDLQQLLAAVEQTTRPTTVPADGQ